MSDEIVNEMEPKRYHVYQNDAGEFFAVRDLEYGKKEQCGPLPTAEKAAAILREWQKADANQWAQVYQNACDQIGAGLKLYPHQEAILEQLANDDVTSVTITARKTQISDPQMTIRELRCVIADYTAEFRQLRTEIDQKDERIRQLQVENARLTARHAELRDAVERQSATLKRQSNSTMLHTVAGEDVAALTALRLDEILEGKFKGIEEIDWLPAQSVVEELATMTARESALREAVALVAGDLTIYASEKTDLSMKNASKDNGASCYAAGQAMVAESVANQLDAILKGAGK